MNNEVAQAAAGDAGAMTPFLFAVGGFLTVFAVLKLIGAMMIEVEDEHVALVTRFGKLREVLAKAGGQFFPSAIFPWVEVTHVSIARDFRHFTKVHINDARGTTLLVDLWVEFRIVDPQRAVFSVEDWDKSLKNLVAHAATSILGSREFSQILHDRLELGNQLQNDIAQETARWGIRIERAFIRNVTLLPEVSQQMFESISAQLERARAEIEENGRLSVARLEAETADKVATLVAQAKGQYPAFIGKGFEAIREMGPEVLEAYNELYALAQVRPQRTVAFRGFGAADVRAVDAAMLTVSKDAESESPATHTRR